MRTSLVLLPAILLSGPYPASAQIQPDQRRIVVEGYGEIKTPPDIATIHYTLRGEGSTSDEAVRAMVAKGAKIEDGLRTIDASIDPRTSDISVSPARGGECQDRRFDREDDRLSQGPCAIVGYVATQEITVRTSDVKDAGTMVGLAARHGDNVTIQQFGLADPRPAKREALAAALADAQAKAAALAAGTHEKLGPIISVSTTSRDGAHDIVVTGSRITQGNLNSLPAVKVNLNAERIVTNATVTVAYSITP